MMKRKRLSTSARLALYERERGAKDFPDCNLCGGQVTPGQAWDESHFPVPHAMGGTVTGIAHRRCNRGHGAKVVVPAAAKAKRARARFVGATRGSARPMPFGRDDRLKRKIGTREIVWRDGGAPFVIGQERP